MYIYVYIEAHCCVYACMLYIICIYVDKQLHIYIHICVYAVYSECTSTSRGNMSITWNLPSLHIESTYNSHVSPGLAEVLLAAVLLLGFAGNVETFTEAGRFLILCSFQS